MVGIISEREEPLRKRAGKKVNKDNNRTSSRDPQQLLASGSTASGASELTTSKGVQTDEGEKKIHCDSEFMTMNRSG